MATTYTQEQWDDENARLRDLYATERDEKIAAVQAEADKAKAESDKALEDQKTDYEGKLTTAAEKLQETIDANTKAVADAKAASDKALADLKDQTDQAAKAAKEAADKALADLRDQLTEAQQQRDGLQKQLAQAEVAMTGVIQQVSGALPTAETLFTAFAQQLGVMVQQAHDAIPKLHDLASGVTDVVTGSPLAKEKRRQELLAQQKAVEDAIANLG